jgi:hypothetical protein
VADFTGIQYTANPTDRTLARLSQLEGSECSK